MAGLGWSPGGSWEEVGGPGGGRRSWRRSGGGSWEEIREEVSLRGKLKRYGYEVRLSEIREYGKVTRYGSEVRLRDDDYEVMVTR